MKCVCVQPTDWEMDNPHSPVFLLLVFSGSDGGKASFSLARPSHNVTCVLYLWLRQHAVLEDASF